MFIKDNLRFNIYASATIDGVTYPNFLDPELRESLGITEIAEPEPPEEYLTHPDRYYRTEQDDAPYVIYTRKSDEQIAEQEKVPPKKFTSLQFLDMFTDEEQLAIATAAMSSAPVKLWYDKMLAADFITIEDPRTALGLNALVSAGLITEARKEEIIASM